MNAGGPGRLSFIVGGLVGAGVALLYAPRSGAETRSFLARKTRASAQTLSDLKRRAVRQSEQLKDEAAKLGSAIRAGIAEELGGVQGEVDRLTAAASERLREC